MILNDRRIRDLASQGMIQPFEPRQVRQIGNDVARRVISYGTSSYGYDVRVARDFKIFSPVRASCVDPKRFDEAALVDVVARAVDSYNGEHVLIPPHSFALGRSVERFEMPANVLGVCLGKSTYARCGIIVNVTPLEPGWKGYVTIEISNTTPLPAKIYAEEGIMQVLFFEGEPCATTYADRAGKYQDQRGIEPAKV